MRHPDSLHDTAPLKDEPFASRFKHNAKKHLQNEPQYLRAVANLVEKAPGGNSAIEAWINLAFTPADSSYQRSYGLRKERGPWRPSTKQVKAFVQFYWKMFHGEDAIGFLRRLKLDGLQLRDTHSIVPAQLTLIIPVKKEPGSPPLSPLTELSESDDEDILVPASNPQISSTQAVSGPPPPTIIKVERPPSPHLRTRIRSQNVALKLESVSIIQTPIRDRLRQRPPPPKAPERPQRPERRLTLPRAAKLKTTQLLLESQPDTSQLPPVSAAPVADDTAIGSSPIPKEVPTQVTRRPIRRDKEAKGTTKPTVKRFTRSEKVEAPPTAQDVIMEAKLEALDDAELLCSLKDPLPEAPKSWIDDDQPATDPMMEVQNESSSSGEPAVLDVTAHLPKLLCSLKDPLPEAPKSWIDDDQPASDPMVEAQNESSSSGEPTVLNVAVHLPKLLCSLKDPLPLPLPEAPKSWIDDDQPASDPMVEAQKESSSSGVPAVLDVAAHLPKPPLKEYPPIWAQASTKSFLISRQEVCESFKWFRSYQGGVYQKDGSVKGYFLSAHSAQRDSFECGGKIIISHGGGKSENSYLIRPGVSVTRAAQDQQAQDLSVRALMETYHKSVPLVLLIDDKYEPFPFDLNSKDVYMTVLGFYRIIHAWAEYQPSRSNASGRVVRYKFAFQWCEDQGQPWWWTGPDEDTSAMDVNQEAPESSAAMDVDETAMIPTRITMSPPQPPSLYTNCTTCDKASPHVFTLGWVCLNPDCRSFWRYPNFHRMIPDQLEYNPAFLSLIDFRPLPPNYTLAPDPPVLAPKDGIVTAYEHSRGWHCLKCGRLSCRSAWEHYQCPNCQDTQKINGIIRPANTLTAIRIPTFDKFYDSQVEPNSGIQRLPQGLFQHLGSTLLGNYQTFVLPGGKGKIHLIKSNRLACDEADKIFEAYQEQASAGTLHFRRWPLRSHKLRGQCLTNYFSQNSGETYHYVGGADNTVPFHLAPAAVLQAHNLIEKRIFEALGKRHKFNEVLSAAYMEKQKMAFHSDSERGLGPVVAGLSMGSPALMHFRALAKYVPRTEQRTTLLTVVLRHGDVLMMEGAGVQDFYEHTVVPTNFRIAATARWIEPHHVVDEPLVNRRG